MFIHSDLEFEVTLKLPPSINRTYKTNRHGDFYMDPKAKAWIVDSVSSMTTKWVQQTEKWRRVRAVKDCIIHVAVTMQCPESRDIDSSIKIVLDTAIEKTLGLNDRAVRHLEVDKAIATTEKQQKVHLLLSIIPKNTLKSSTEAA